MGSEARIEVDAEVISGQHTFMHFDLHTDPEGVGAWL